MADALGIDPDAVVGKLIRLWVWADQQTIDGKNSLLTRGLIDRIIGMDGFANAMDQAGWLEQDSDGRISFPRFGDHNGKTAKDRLLNLKRQQNKRMSDRQALRDSAVTDLSRFERDRKTGSSRNGRANDDNQRRDTVPDGECDDDLRDSAQPLSVSGEVAETAQDAENTVYIAELDRFVPLNAVAQLSRAERDNTVTTVQYSNNITGTGTDRPVLSIPKLIESHPELQELAGNPVKPVQDSRYQESCLGHLRRADIARCWEQAPECHTAWKAWIGRWYPKQLGSDGALLRGANQAEAAIVLASVIGLQKRLPKQVRSIVGYWRSVVTKGHWADLCDSKSLQTACRFVKEHYGT